MPENQSAASLSVAKEKNVVPLYEYRCRKCSREFEELVMGNAQPACPSCQSQDLERVLSVVAVGKSQPEPPPSPCGSCASRGGCGFN
jgi:putative FmdB family regulatory protein